MARPNRIEYSGAWYWITNRAMPNRQVFQEQHDYQLFVSMLPEIAERFHIELHSYCLLPTEFHILVRCQLANLSEGMRHLQSLYTQRWNRNWRSAGPLFRGRYLATLFQHEQYLLPLSAMLHHLPTCYELCGRIDQYAWSSAADYLEQRPITPSLHTAEVHRQVEQLGMTYADFMLGTDWHSIGQLLSAKKRPVILGDQQFKQEVVARDEAGAAQHVWQESPEPAELEKVLSSVSAVMDVQPKALFEARRGQLNIPRMMAIYLSHCQARLSLNQLADHFGMAHYSSASSAMQRYQKLRAKEHHIRRLESEVLRRLEH